jgi:hypothetical protein
MIKFETFCSERPFEVYKKAVDRKANAVVKTELLNIETDMESCYDDYKNHHDNNNIEMISQSSIGIAHKNSLLDLFGAKAKVIKDFRSEFFRINPSTYNNLCPYCAISEANTTEHILPKERFPEYAIDVLNLIPVCSQCNGKKGEYIVDSHGNRFTINFYKDELPNVQFLYAVIMYNGTELKVKYKLDNPEGAIDANVYSLICRHYDRFNLLERYNDQAIAHLPEIKNNYLAERFNTAAAFDEFATKQLIKCQLDQPALGFNHWHIVLRMAAATSLDFKNYIMNHPLL